MSNAYGFDFLRTEHLDESAQQDVVPTTSKASDTVGEDDGEPRVLSEEALVEIQNKPILEKQHMILNFLRAHRGSGCLAPNVIYKNTGIDLEEDDKLAEMLQKNTKIKVEMVPDPENPALLIATYAYQAKYSTVRDRVTLLAQINRKVSGVPKKDLEDSYLGVEEDIQALITAGDVVAVNNTEDKDKILFPRGEAFLVELDGIVSLKFTYRPKIKVISRGTNDMDVTMNGADGEGTKKDQNEEDSFAFPSNDVHMIEVDADPRSQIRRGEAIQVGGEWFRVSSAVKAGVPLSEQPTRAQAPLSVVSRDDLSKRNEIDGYIRPFNSKVISLDNSLSPNGIENVQKAKEAKERLAKLAHGAGVTRSSGGGGGSLGVLVGQALGSLAHTGNPKTLASSAVSSSVPISASARRKRNAAGAPITGSSKEELIAAASDLTLATFSHARRHGCTKDIRQMYLETASLVPESDAELQALLLQHKLLEP